MTEVDPIGSSAPRSPYHQHPVAVGLVLMTVVFGAFISIGSLSQLMNLPFGVWFTECAIFLMIPFGVMQVLGVDPLRETAFDSTTLRAVGLGFALGVVNYFAWPIPLMSVMHSVLPPQVLEVFDGSQVFRSVTGVELALVVAGVSFAAPIAEEFFFRGVLQQRLMAAMAPPRAIVVTALIFSAFHLDPVGFLARFELGMLFGLLAWRSGSIWPGIAAHLGNNLFASALFLLGNTVEKDDSELPTSTVLMVMAVGNVLLILLARFAVGKLEAPRAAQETQMPRLSLVRAFAPVLGVSAVGFALVGLLDWRGAALRLYETSHPMPHHRTAPGLDEARAQARKGLILLDEYYDRWNAARHDLEAQESAQ